MTFEIRVVAPQEIYELRRRVLRNNDPSVDVTDARDGEAEALHLGVVSDGAIVTCGSVYPSTSPLHPEVSTYQLRYLATDVAYQGRGYGAALLAALERDVFERGAREIWANGRDSALGFYDREGWHRMPGSEHLSPYTGLPHTVIWKSLAN